MKKERIWELDALRGICILGVIVIHTLYDLSSFAGLSITFSPVHLFIQQYGGILFVILSGLCCTLGSRSFRRGLLVFICGLLISAVTAGMFLLGMADRSVLIWFGVLHLLGVCMMLYPLYRKLPTCTLAVLGALIVVLGYTVCKNPVSQKWLFPFGFVTADFTSADYFPILPHLGWYMLGTVIGRTVYREKKTLLPGSFQDFFLIRFFRFCGRQSLWIYLLHQPLVFGILELVLFLKQH